MAELLDTMSSVKLGRFRSQFEVSYVSTHTEESWHNGTVRLWMTWYTLPFLAEEITPATHVMQISYNELNTLVSDKAKM